MAVRRTAKDIATAIDQVNTTSADISKSSTYVGHTAQELSALTKQLKTMVEKFKV